MLKEILKALQDRLNQLESLNYVSEDWGQLDFYAERPPVIFPCVLFDAGKIDFSDCGKHSQEGSGTIVLRIADYKPVDISSTPFDESQFEFLDLVTEIFAAVQGLCGESFSGMTRTRLEKIPRQDSIREYEMTFQFTMVDESAMKTYRKVTVPVDISIS